MLSLSTPFYTKIPLWAIFYPFTVAHFILQSIVYYFLTQDSITQHLQSIAEQSVSTYPSINTSDLENLKLKLPPLKEQKAIAATLSCLDNKIELNNRMNKILEEMAQIIFKSWFVDFEPFQNGEFVDSELGRIPKGWKVAELGNAAKISRESINPLKFSDILFEHYSIPAYDESEFPVFEKGSQIKSNKYVLNKDSFIISKLNPRIKRIWRPYCITNHAICSTEFIVYNAIKKQQNVFYYSVIDSPLFMDFLLAHTTGSTGSRQRVSPDDTLKYKIVLPPDYVIDNFCKTVSPFYKTMAKNILEIQKLQKIRNLLLPKLMSGEIKVPVEK